MRPKRDDAKKPISLRFTPTVIELIGQAAGRRGWTRQKWMDRLVERGLQGEGLLERPAGDDPPRGRKTDVSPRFKGTESTT
jgi:hypothetical protein